MIRKFNFTGRKKINRSGVRVDLIKNNNGAWSFSISFNLQDLLLPAEAHIYVEAYHRTAYQRFDFGTIGAKRIPKERALFRFSNRVVPLFRLKVVDKTGSHGRILASVDKIRPARIDDLPTGSQSLLFVEYEDLGTVIWQLDLDGDWPVLKLNHRIDEISLIAASDSRFLPLVYPEAFRRILTRILIEDEHTDPDCDDDWPSLWLKLACGLPGIADPPPIKKGDQQVWVDRAVEAFAGHNRLLDLFNQSTQ